MRRRGIVRVRFPQAGRPDLPRKLRAILAADVEGYSRLMGADDTGAVKLLSRYRLIIQGEVTRFSGNLFSEAGDGFLAEFENADAALTVSSSALTSSKEAPR